MTEDEKIKTVKRAMAIALNQWCCDTNHTFNLPMDAWPVMAQAAIAALKE